MDSLPSPTPTSLSSSSPRELPRVDDDTSSDTSSPLLRFMCSFGGRIVPRPPSSSLSYINGDTRLVSLDRRHSLRQIFEKLSKTFLNSRPFSLKYQLPDHSLDSLISVSTDEDLENLFEEYDRLNSASKGSTSSRIRLFLFPAKSESAPPSVIGSLLDESKSETWFADALNSSVNSLLGLEDEGRGEYAAKGFDEISSFGSANSAVNLSNLPPISDQRGIEEQFAQMNLGQRGDEGFKESQPQQVKLGQGEVLSNDAESRTIYINSNPKRESPVSSDSGYHAPSAVPDAAAGGYVLPSVPPEQLQQPQPIAHYHQQPQQQYIPANTHFVHHPVTGGVVPVSPYFHPITAHPIQQSHQPQVYYLPVRQPAPYNLTTAVPAPNLAGPNSAQTAGKPAIPIAQVSAAAAPQPELQYRTPTPAAAPAPAPAPQTVLQPQLIRVAAPDQAHAFAGMGYHLVQQHHLSQPPATMTNFRYEYPAADPANAQLYYSQTTSQPAIIPPAAQYQAVTSVAVTTDAGAPGDAKATSWSC